LNDENPVSVKIEVPKEATSAIVEAVADLFSPATEFLGALGDKIRIYRTNAALRALEAAQSTASKAGLKLSGPPLKFLVPFLEKASLEDEDSELSEIWGNLLVSAATEYDEQLLVCSDVLSQIGPIGAKTVANLGSKVDTAESHWVGLRFQLEDFQTDISGWFYRFVIREGNFPSKDFDSNDFNKLFTDKPLMLTDMGLPSIGIPGLSMYAEMEYDWGFNASHAVALERLGLVKRGQFDARFDIINGVHVKDDEKGEYPISMGYVGLTPFGFHFYQRCTRPQPAKKKSKETRKARKATQRAE
jgi:hypothetical protein